MMYEVGAFPGLVLFFELCVLGTLLVVASRRHRPDARFQVKIFLLAFALRFMLSIIIYQFGLVEILKDEDASGWTGGVVVYNIWEQEGVGILELPFAMRHMYTGQQPGPQFLRNPHRGYFYLLGVLFYLTNTPARLPAAALNGLFGALTVILSYRVARELFSSWVAQRVAWWICFFPSMLIWSAMTIKEPVVICTEVAGLYACTQLCRGRLTFKYVAGGLAAAFFLMPFRFYAAYFMAMATILSIAAPRLLRTRNRLLTAFLGCTVGPLLFASIGYIAYRQMEQSESYSYNVELVTGFRNGVATGGDQSGAGSAAGLHFDMNSPVGFAVGTLYGAAHLLLAPFPWQLGGASLRMILTLPELLYWWYLVVYGLVPGALFVLRRRLSDTWVIFLFIGAFGFLYSTMFGNVGLVFRQRAQLLPYLLILAAVGLERRMLKRKAKRGAQDAAPRHGPPGFLDASWPSPRPHASSPRADVRGRP